MPGLGDDVQSMKAGLMEVADIFVLNKAERDGADRLDSRSKRCCNLRPERERWKPPVVRTTATEGSRHRRRSPRRSSSSARSVEASGERRARTLEHWKQRLLVLLEEQLLERALGGPEAKRALETLAGEVADRKKDPYAAVRELRPARR